MGIVVRMDALALSRKVDQLPDHAKRQHLLYAQALRALTAKETKWLKQYEESRKNAHT